MATPVVDSQAASWLRAGRGAAPPVPAGPLKVAVLVDLLLGPAAGGHVKSWERLAQAAARRPEAVDLTIHFMGEKDEEVALARNVRYHLHPPRFSTARLPFLSHIPDHTDLAFYHRGLAPHLAQCDVIHTTDAFFAFARTGLAVARRRGIPLVNSLHTDVPGYTQIYTAVTVERVLGRGMLGRFMLNGLKVHLRAERYMRRRLAAHQRHCACVLVSSSIDRDDLRQRLPGVPVGFLRRGTDLALFNPAQRDRGWLKAKWGIPPDRLVVLFVGRVNRGKNVLVVAEAVEKLIRAGLPLHLICAGKGEERQVILDRLGANASCPGLVMGGDLARLYASADVFAMPSEIEVVCNVVQEALASGLPVALSDRGPLSWLITPGANGALVSSEGPDQWMAALKCLCADRERLSDMGRAARARAEEQLASWDDVLAQDLLPVWRAAIPMGQPGHPRSGG